MTRKLLCIAGSLCWAVVLYVGYSLYQSVYNQNVPGYPNSNQFNLYVLFPATLLLGNLLAIFIVQKIPAAVFALIILFQIACGFGLIMLAGGGV